MNNLINKFGKNWWAWVLILVLPIGAVGATVFTGATLNNSIIGSTSQEFGVDFAKTTNPCALSSTVGSTCTQSIALNYNMPDANYTAACSLIPTTGATGSTNVIVHVTGKNSTTLTVEYVTAFSISGQPTDITVSETDCVIGGS
jgi:hypothetical protein